MTQDHSDTIAFLHVAVEILQDLEPSGEWRENALLEQWQKSRYSLTRRQVVELKQFLQGEVDRLNSPQRTDF